MYCRRKFKTPQTYRRLLHRGWSVSTDHRRPHQDKARPNRSNQATDPTPERRHRGTSRDENIFATGYTSMLKTTKKISGGRVSLISWTRCGWGVDEEGENSNRSGGAREHPDFLLLLVANLIQSSKSGFQGPEIFFLFFFTISPSQRIVSTRSSHIAPSSFPLLNWVDRLSLTCEYYHRISCVQQIIQISFIIPAMIW